MLYLKRKDEEIVIGKETEIVIEKETEKTGVVILEQILVGVSDSKGFRSLKIRQIKFGSALRPDECAKICYQIKEDKCFFEVSVTRRHLKVVVASGTLMTDLKVVCHEME